jgi:peptidoglycan hydrolase-like protein with peptidoglycan-binding domain
MAEQNGRLSDSSLAPIPGGRLSREAAANWLALRREGGKKLGIWISPLGPQSSYRTFAEQQHFWDLYQARRGNLAARPGTSNHGLGHAVDLAAPIPMRRVIDGFGARYGWRWGEAPSERWHVTYYGGGAAKADALDLDDHRSLGRGDSGEDVRRVQQWLADHHVDLIVDGEFGPATEDAVNQLYRDYGHQPHSRFGDVGWSIIEGKHPWRVLTGQERQHLATLFSARRVARRHGGWERVGGGHRRRAEDALEWLVARRKEIWRLGKREGWRTNNRKRRYRILREATQGQGGGAPAPQPSPTPTPIPRPPRPSRDALRAERLRTLGLKHPAMTIEEARRAGLPLAAALAFLEKESSGVDRDGVHRFGLNLFGSDAVRNPVKGGRVTKARYDRYLRNRRAGLGMQGVGPCQLTWWEFQDMADRAGGCWVPRFNMRIGFAVGARLIQQNGPHDGAMRWNGTGSAAARYADDWVQKRRRWHDVLDG